MMGRLSRTLQPIGVRMRWRACICRMVWEVLITWLSLHTILPVQLLFSNQMFMTVGGLCHPL